MDNDTAQHQLRQTILARFGELALRSDDLDEILTEACRLVGQALGTDFAKVIELQPDGKTLLVRAGIGWKDGVVGIATIALADDTSEAYALKTGEPMISPDIDLETRFRYADFLIDNGAKAVANVIIIGAKGRPPFGILQIDSRTPREFSDDDVAFLRTYANLLAATVERLHALAEIRETSTRLTLALDVGELGSFRMDTASGQTTGSQRYHTILRGPSASTGADWAWQALVEQIVPDERAAVAAAMQSAIDGGKDLRVEYRINRASDAALRWIELRARHDTKQGDLNQMIGIIADITDRKLAEQSLVQTKALLETQVAERTVLLARSNAQLDAFAYTVSHDLRAPLRAMEGFARILLDDHGAELGEDGITYATRIVGAARRMEALINDLLAFSRIKRAELVMKSVDPARAIRQAITEIRASGNGPSVPTFDIAPSFPLVRADSRILSQIIGNLLINAAKFTSPVRAAHIAVHAERRANTVRIWVEDNGIGIAPENHDRIFTVFGRLHGQEAFPGTGVGLAIVKAGVERMEGRYGLDSTLGKGSRFWIELPAADAA